MTAFITCLSAMIVALAAAGSITTLAIESLMTGEVWGFYGRFSRTRHPGMFAFCMGNFFGLLTLATVVFAKALDGMM